MTPWSTIQAQFARFGELRSQSADAWQGEIALPAELADFYAQVGPWGKTYHENVGPTGITLSETSISFPPLHRLWSLQAGYRWDASDNSPVTDWQDHWLVIADQNADPIIYDTASGRILCAMHGTGRWDADELAPDLPTLLTALLAIANVYEDADEDLRDDDWNLKPGHRAEAIKRLTGILGDKNEAEAFFETVEG